MQQQLQRMREEGNARVLLCHLRRLHHCRMQAQQMEQDAVKERMGLGPQLEQRHVIQRAIAQALRQTNDQAQSWYEACLGVSEACRVDELRDHTDRIDLRVELQAVVVGR